MGVTTTCDNCGLTYVPSSPGDRAEHRSHHRRMSLTWRPLTTEVVVARDGEFRVVAVPPSAPQRLRVRAERIGRRANLEAAYDFGVYDANYFGPLKTHAFVGVEARSAVSLVVVECRPAVMCIPWENVIQSPIDDTWRAYRRDVMIEQPQGGHWTVGFVWVSPAARRRSYARRTLAGAAAALGTRTADFAWYSPFSHAGRALVQSLSPDSVLIGSGLTGAGELPQAS